MNPFVERHQEEIGGVLSCFDRVVITGTWPDICHPKAMAGYLSYRDIRLFDYARRAEPLRDEVRANAGKCLHYYFYLVEEQFDLSAILNANDNCC